jgi:hypothetical protein
MSSVRTAVATLLREETRKEHFKTMLDIPGGLMRRKLIKVSCSSTCEQPSVRFNKPGGLGSGVCRGRRKRHIYLFYNTANGRGNTADGEGKPNYGWVVRKSPRLINHLLFCDLPMSREDSPCRVEGL